MEHRGQAEVLEDVTLTPALRAALRSLDEVDVQHIFRDRAVVIKSLPRLIRGVYKSAMRTALTEAADRGAAGDDWGCAGRGSCSCSCPECCSSDHLEEVSFPSVSCTRGFHWIELLLGSQAPSENARRVQQRRSRTASDSVERKAERAFCLANSLRLARLWRVHPLPRVTITL